MNREVLFLISIEEMYELNLVVITISRLNFDLSSILHWLFCNYLPLKEDVYQNVNRDSGQSLSDLLKANTFITSIINLGQVMKFSTYFP